MIRPIEMFKLSNMLWEDLIEAQIPIEGFPMVVAMHDRVIHNLNVGGQLEWTQDEEDLMFEEGHRIYRMPDDRGITWD